MNETLKTIQERFSCRAYKDEMPSDELLIQIAQAAVASPSAMNRQDWRVIVVKNRVLISDMEAEGMKALGAMEDHSAYDRIMSRGGKLYYNAPCMMIFPMASNASMDCGILTQTASLAAASLGLDNVICGLAGLCFSAGRAEEFKARLGFPEGFVFGCALLLGYGCGKNPPHTPDTAKISVIE